MSTKTSIKRIAAVAAVALTLGGFTAVSAHAEYVQSAYRAASITDSGTASTAVAHTSILAVTQLCGGGFPDANGNNWSADYHLKITSEPSTSAIMPTNDLALVTASGTPSGYTNVNSTSVYLPGDGNNGYTNTAQAKCTAQGRATAYFTVTFTPDVAGTYSFVAYTTDVATSGSVSATWTITVAAKAAISAAASSVLAAVGATTPTTTTDAATITGSKSAGTLAANIAVLARNSATANNADAATISATVSGPGLISFTNYAAAGRAISQGTANNTQGINVYGDGTSGVGTVTISSGTTVLATKTVTFYGAAAKIAVTVLKAVVPVSGANKGSAAKAISITETDANGVALPQSAFGTLTLTSATVASITSALSNVDTTTAASGCSATTPCYDLTPGATAGSAVLTVADTTNTLTAATVSVRASSATPTKVTFTTDSSSYNSGALGTLTIKVEDSAGIVPADTYAVFSSAGATSTSALLTGTLPTTSVTVDGTGTATVAFNAPLADGSATISATGAATTIAVTPVTFTVTSGASTAAQAAVDAANEATDAANAATDAANNAMDSADAAQQAALDAGDKADAALAAVTDLASKVADIATQISALSSLVSKIAASVAKISAKVKA